MVRLPRFFTVLKSRIMFVKMYKFEKSVNFNDEGNSSRRRGGFMSFYRSEADMMAQYLLYIIVS